MNNRKLKESSTNSSASGKGRISMFESTVTPFFTSMTNAMGIDTQQQQMSHKRKGRNLKDQPRNTQEYIERLVQQNQYSGFHSHVAADENDDGFGLGFSFAGGGDNYQFKQNQGDGDFFLSSGEDFDDQFMFLGGGDGEGQFQGNQQFFQSIATDDNLNGDGSAFFQSKAQSEVRQWQNSLHPYTQTISIDKNQNYFDYFSFQNDPSLIQNKNSGIKKQTNQPKKRSNVAQMNDEKKQNIIYEVESKFQCEGQTNFITNNLSHSKSQSRHSMKSQKKQISNEKEKENKPNDFQALRQSIIKEISQMDSDEWQERKNQDFEDNVKQCVKQNKLEKNESLKKTIVNQKSGEKQPNIEQKKKNNNFNQSLINRLMESDIESVMDNQRNQIDQRDSQQKRLQIGIGKKQKVMQGIYESQVEEVTNERIDIFKKTDKSMLRKNSIGSDGKQQKKEQFSNMKRKQSGEGNNILMNNNSDFDRPSNLIQNIKQQVNTPHQIIREEIRLQKVQEKPQKPEVSFPQPNQIKKRRTLFQFKPRNRFSVKNQVIDERQQFQHEDNHKITIKNEFMSENLQFQNDFETKPIQQQYQSATKENNYGRKFYNKTIHQRISNDLRDTSKKSFNNMKVDDNEKNLSNQQAKKETPLKEYHENSINNNHNDTVKNEQKNELKKQRKFNFSNMRKKSEEKNTIQNNPQQKQTISVIPQKEADNHDLQHSKQDTSNNGSDNKSSRRNRFEFNFINKRRGVNKKPSVISDDRLQKNSQTSSTHSLSSDGIKIDTTGFLNNVLHSGGETERNTKRQQSRNNREKPILNFKRLNRFSAMFANRDAPNKDKKSLFQGSNPHSKEEQAKNTKNEQYQDNKKQTNNENENISKDTKYQKSTLFLNKRQVNQQQQQNSEQKNNENFTDKNLNSLTNNLKDSCQEQQSAQLFSERDFSYKSEQNHKISSYTEKQSPSSGIIKPKFIFSKRTPAKLTAKIVHKSENKSKNNTFDTIKRIDNQNITNDVEIDDDQLSFDSEMLSQQTPDNTFSRNINNRETLIKKRTNNLMDSSDKIQNTLLSKIDVQRQTKQIRAISQSSFPSISSRSRKSAQMMKKLIDVIEEVHQVHEAIRKAKRESEQQYVRVRFLDNLARQRFSDEKIRRLGSCDGDFQI